MMEKKYDIIIVGGGVIGTFHAYHALTQGLSVLQLEKDNFPVGSTVRNFGQVVPSGMEGKWFEYGVDSTAIYKYIQSKSDISVRQHGSLYIASDEDEVILINELKQHYDCMGYTCNYLEANALIAKYPTLKKHYAKAAIFFPEEISVEPDKMILGVQGYLKSSFEKYEILYNMPVVGLDPNQQGVKIRTTNGENFYGEKLVICNGYEYKLLMPEYFAKSGIVISKLQMLRTMPMKNISLPGNILTGLTTRRYESFEHNCPSFKHIKTPAHYVELQKYGIHILFKQAIDGSFIIGDSHEYADVNNFDALGFKNSNYINQLMLAEASRIVEFDVNNIQETWCGFYPQHPDQHIVSENIDDKIYIRTAIGGKGMTASAGYARESMKQILG
ncbi:MAG: TIGR03364 family FAD-dependent oxidoreductase [Pedobacter sp.]|nr:MAG: TIGR03364 family FAD-dependent oxidoreductase [Pedobacter sp.]